MPRLWLSLTVLLLGCAGTAQSRAPSGLRSPKRRTLALRGGGSERASASSPRRARSEDIARGGAGFEGDGHAIDVDGDGIINGAEIRAWLQKVRGRRPRTSISLFPPNGSASDPPRPDVPSRAHAPSSRTAVSRGDRAPAAIHARARAVQSISLSRSRSRSRSALRPRAAPQTAISSLVLIAFEIAFLHYCEAHKILMQASDGSVSHLDIHRKVTAKGWHGMYDGFFPWGLIMVAFKVRGRVRRRRADGASVACRRVARRRDARPP